MGGFSGFNSTSLSFLLPEVTTHITALEYFRDTTRLSPNYLA